MMNIFGKRFTGRFVEGGYVASLPERQRESEIVAVLLPGEAWIKPADDDRATRCTEIADQVVPEYRADNARHTGCGTHTAKRWQAAWDGACIALGGDPKESR